jgi:peptidoglycan hydrolase-like protein with peptidoglycan-binding domain
MACESTNTTSHTFARSLPQVRPGQHGTYVLALQIELHQRGYKLQGTAYYGSKTLAAVKDYQRRHRIKASGIVGPRTWDSLIGGLSPDQTGPNMLRYVPRFQVLPGDRNQNRTQYLINVVERTAIDYNRVSKAWDGHTYGPAMQQLVKEFQRKNGIKASGIVGPKTWAAYYKVVSATGSWGC